MPDLEEPVELYRACSLAEAHAIRAALEDAEIPVRVEGNLLQGAVLVGRIHLERAEAILSTFLEADRRSRAGLSADSCLACSAPMTEANACPVCGWSFDVVPTNPGGSEDESEGELAEPPLPVLPSPRTKSPAGVETTLRVICLVSGAGLLMLGLTDIPDLVQHIGRENFFRFLGRALANGLELIAGTYLLIRGIREPRRHVDEKRHAADAA